MENNPIYFGIPKKYFYILFIFSLLNILILNIFLQPFVIPFNSDSEGYLESARYFLGQIESNSIQYPQRLLKPLEPLLAGAVSYIFDFGPAFNFINSLFYFFIGFIIFYIIKLLFNDNRQALIGSILFLTAYPMLQYGIAFMTDLGGWFFFVLSVYLTLLFLKEPSFKIAIFNGLAVSVGFLLKEYAAPGAIFFVICLFFIPLHPENPRPVRNKIFNGVKDEWKVKKENFLNTPSFRADVTGFIYKDSFVKKIKYLLCFIGFFLIPFGIWQLFVYLKFHYSYYDWYMLNTSHIATIKRQALRLITKSLGASFLLGWIFVLAGLLKLRQMSKQNQKILLALILPSFSFLLWPGVSSRLYYVIGLLLSILASWGIISWLGAKQKKILYITASLALVITGNYFWLIYDDKLRHIFVNLFNINY